jgi:hypothetical protein
VFLRYYSLGLILQGLSLHKLLNAQLHNCRQWMHIRAKLIKAQAATWCLIKHCHYLQIRWGIIKFQSCAQRLFLFCDEKDIVDELILEAMELHFNLIHNKTMHLQTMMIILNSLHEKGFYFNYKHIFFTVHLILHWWMSLNFSSLLNFHTFFTTEL